MQQPSLTLVCIWNTTEHEWSSHVNLQQMAAVCKPGGQIILLQHGKASWDWLNHRLDDEAHAHYVKWGCWWNRDILQIVQQV